MSSSMGEKIRLTVFGQSHGEAIGVVIDGLRAGERIDIEQLSRFMARRAPGQSPLSTPRREKDEPRFLSGLVDGFTCGAPLCAVIENTNARSADYDALKRLPRPAHADYAALMRDGQWADLRGGGHFSGRLTAPLCVAGGIALQILSRRGVWIGAHLSSVGLENDARFDPVNIDKDALLKPGLSDFPVIDPAAGARMRAEIEAARAEGDSVGGTIECCALGLGAGVGEPMFGGVENRLAAALFGIPAVKGVEFGDGFDGARMRGSEHNDPFIARDGRVRTATNRHGGILGGITSGMPLMVRVAVKPTPSIAREQKSVNLDTMREERLRVRGRHDPCIAPRAVPVVEAVCALVLMDMMAQCGRL